MTATEEIEALKQRMTVMEREIAELKAVQRREGAGHPWRRVIGSLANNPLYDEWREAMAEYRRQREAEEEARES